MSPTLSEPGKGSLNDDFRRFFDLSLDLLAITSPEGSFKRLNQAWEQALGYSISELLATPTANLIHPEDLAAVQLLQQRDRAQVPMVRNFVNRFRKRDGTYLWLEWTAHYYPEEDQSYCVARDITARKQAEEAMLRSQEAYRRIADNAPVLIWISGQDKLCYFFNQTWLEFRGRTLQEEAGNGWADGVHQDDYQRCLETYFTAFDARQFFEMEYRLQRADGEYRWMLDIGVPNYDSNGTFIGYVGTCVDVHERKLAENQLRQSESTLRQLINSSPDVVIMTDNQNQIEVVNHRAVHLFDRPETELIGASVYDMMLPMATELRRSMIKKMFAEGETQHYAIDYPDGNVEVTNAPIFDDQGNIIHIASFVHDITHLKQIEYALRKSEEQFRNILEAAAEGILLANARGEIILTNPELLENFGYTREELIGQTVEMLLPEAKQATHIAHRADYLDHPSTRPMGIGMELYGRRKDGSVFPVEVSLSHIQTDGDLLVMAMIIDITERKQIEQSRLENQQLQDDLKKEREIIQLRQQFTSMVSHEFRTPLTAIATTCEILDRYYDRQSESQRKERILGLKSQVLTMLNLLDDMLALNKIQARAEKFEPTRLDLNALCKRVIETVQLADQNQHPLHLSVADDLSNIYADSHLLEHILTNLLTNAMKYSPIGSPVHLRVTGDDDRVWFEVQDFGRGISQREQAHLFEAFFRAGNARDVSGTGLGLVIVKHNVELHGGMITFESFENQGTTFRVELPANRPNEL